MANPIDPCLLRNVLKMQYVHQTGRGVLCLIAWKYSSKDIFGQLGGAKIELLLCFIVLYYCMYARTYD